MTDDDDFRGESLIESGRLLRCKNLIKTKYTIRILDIHNTRKFNK